MFDLDKILERVVVEADCWIWQGSHVRGYGKVTSWVHGRTVNGQVHKVVYELLLDTKVPSGLHLDHLCKRTMCCNPDHLEPVTPRVNVLRSGGRAARNARATSCRRGHALAGANLYIRPDGKGRQCRECQKVNERRHKAERGYGS